MFTAYGGGGGSTGGVPAAGVLRVPALPLAGMKRRSGWAAAAGGGGDDDGMDGTNGETAGSAYQYHHSDTNDTAADMPPLEFVLMTAPLLPPPAPAAYAFSAAVDVHSLAVLAVQVVPLPAAAGGGVPDMAAARIKGRAEDLLERELAALKGELQLGGSGVHAGGDVAHLHAVAPYLPPPVLAAAGARATTGLPDYVWVDTATAGAVYVFHRLAAALRAALPPAASNPASGGRPPPWVAATNRHLLELAAAWNLSPVEVLRVPTAFGPATTVGAGDIAVIGADTASEPGCAFAAPCAGVASATADTPVPSTSPWRCAASTPPAAVSVPRLDWSRAGALIRSTIGLGVAAQVADTVAPLDAAATMTTVTTLPWRDGRRRLAPHADGGSGSGSGNAGEHAPWWETWGAVDLPPPPPSCSPLELLLHAVLAASPVPASAGEVVASFLAGESPIRFSFHGHFMSSHAPPAPAALLPSLPRPTSGRAASGLGWGAVHSSTASLATLVPPAPTLLDAAAWSPRGSPFAAFSSGGPQPTPRGAFQPPTAYVSTTPAASPPVSRYAGLFAPAAAASAAAGCGIPPAPPAPPCARPPPPPMPSFSWLLSRPPAL